MYLKYNYKYCLCSKIIINNLCPIKIKIAIIEEKYSQIKNLYESEKQKIHFVNCISKPANNIIELCKTLDCDEMPCHFKKTIYECIESVQQFLRLSENFLSTNKN